MKRNQKLSMAMLSLFTASTVAFSNPSVQHWEKLLIQSNAAKLRSELSQFQMYPVSGAISSEFGLRIHPISGLQKIHSGIDIAASEGESFVSVADGKVIEARTAGGYGNVIVIKHSRGFKTRYAHAKKILVTLGQNVRKGEVIGLVGSSGQSTGPHVHFEISHFNQDIDPAEYILARKNITLEEFSKTLYQPKSKVILNDNADLYVNTNPTAKPVQRAVMQNEPQVENRRLTTIPDEPSQTKFAHKVESEVNTIDSIRSEAHGTFTLTNRTLWSLASDIQTDLGHGVINDIMDLLLKLNPSAFKNNDINFRYSHVPLFIPTVNEITALIPETIQTGEAIWTIAKRLKKNYLSDFSIYQIMAAITLKNPEAFMKGNVNLRLSSIPLRIPKEADVMSISYREAVDLYTNSLNEKVREETPLVDVIAKVEFIDE